jgi:small subunit ribosomal protein S8
MVDTIAQLITGLKNANKAGKASASFPYSKMTEAVLDTLHKAGFVGSVSKKGKKVTKTIDVDLVYEDGKPKIEGVQQLSKYSRRMYAKASEANAVRNGYGALVLTTPKGILVDREARKENVGGEILFKIW